MRSLSVGFSFCGVHSSDLGVVLGNNDAAMHSITADYITDVETVNGYEGAYPAGTREGQKEFDLSLICEDMDDGQMARLGWLFGKGKYGELIFDHVPYKNYMVRVTSGITPPTTCYYDNARGVFVYSGVATVTLTAFTPRAYMNSDVLEDYPDVDATSKATLEAGTGIVETSKRPSTSAENVSAETDMLLMNCGTATAHCNISITGKMSGGVEIYNRTTDQKMLITAPDNETHAYLISGQYGFVLDKNTEKRSDQVKTGHFISILPCTPFYRSVDVVASGSSVTVADGTPELAHAGQYIYLGGWKKITAVEPNALTIDGTAAYTGLAYIATLNEITITPVGGSVIDEIQFNYAHTFY